MFIAPPSGAWEQGYRRSEYMLEHMPEHIFEHVLYRTSQSLITWQLTPMLTMPIMVKHIYLFPIGSFNGENMQLSKKMFATMAHWNE